MASELSDIKHDYKVSFVVSIVILFFFTVSGFLLTAGRGLQDNTFVLRFIIYSILGGAGLTYFFLVNLYNFINRKRVLRSIIHDPEDGLMNVKAVANPFLLFLLTFGIFTLPLYFLGKFSNTFLSGVPFKAQQITTFSNVWADSIFPALAENLFIFILLSLVYSWNFNVNRKNRPIFWFVNLLVIPFVFAFLWRLFHLSVYGSSDVALLSTFIFGFIGVLVSMVTMSFIPFAILHFLTNFMLSIKKYGLMSSDATTVLVIGISVVCWLLFFIVYRLDKTKYKGLIK